MIRFENGMLALDYPMTKEHAQVIKDFVQYIKKQEQERIIGLLQGLIETRPEDWEDAYRGYSFERLIELIKGETK